MRGGEGVCEYVVGKIEEGKKKGRKKKKGDLWLMTCDLWPVRVLREK